MKNYNKIKDLLLEAFENLLWKQIKRIKEKVVHIFKNRNRNQREAVLVKFESEESKKTTTKYQIMYRNMKLFWETDIEPIQKSREKIKTEKGFSKKLKAKKWNKD